MIAKARADWADALAEGRAAQFALICLGVWLNAADGLVTVTIMPNVGAELGGHGRFSWATAGFLTGAIIAGASAGRLAGRMGLRPATMMAGGVYAAGCLLSALAPDMTTFLAGRFVQGVGGGWISGFAMVAVALFFPERHLARVFASVAAVWGVATLIGPLLGGLFAADWRWIFVAFAVQAAVFSLAAWNLLRRARAEAQGPGVPWRPLLILALAIGAIALANEAPAPAAAALVAAGLGLLWLALRVNRHTRVQLLPRAAGDLRTTCGAGYAAIFALTASGMGLTVYGPMLLQQLRGLTPLMAGYVVTCEALGWTVAALAVAGAKGEWDRRFVRIGALLAVGSLGLLGFAVRDQPLALVVLGSTLFGAAFGLSWSFMSRRILAALDENERTIGSPALNSAQQAGAAVGAAMAGVVANLAGLGSGADPDTARTAAVWVFAQGLPLAALGAWAAFRLTRRTYSWSSP